MYKKGSFIGPGLHFAAHMTNRLVTGPDLAEYMKLIALLIGCGECRDEYLHLIATDTEYDSQWTWRAHNVINAKLGKESVPWTNTLEYKESYRPGLILYVQALEDFPGHACGSICKMVQ